MPSPTEVFEGDKRKNFTGSTTIGQSGNLLGVLVASATGATLAVSDSTGVIAGAITVDPGAFYPMPCKWVGTLTLTVTGTIDATAFYKA